MAFPSKTTFTFNHSNQQDVITPGVYTPIQLKSNLDSRSGEMLTFVNAIKAVLESVTPGSSGAENLGSAPIAGVAGATPYAQMTDLKAQLNGTVAGQVPDRSLANIKLVLATITAAEIALGTLNFANHDAYTQQALQGGWLANYQSGRFF